MRTTFLKAVFNALLLVTLACNDSTSPTFPTPPPIDSPPVTKPRVDAPFNYDNYNAILAFGLGHPGQSEEDVLAFIQASMAKRRNTFQPCAETEFWDGSFQYPYKPRDTERLRWLLDIFARVPGAQVTLVGNCTLKRQVPLSEQLTWAHQVAQVASEYQNVAIFTHNEFDNCRGRNDWGGNADYCPGKNDIAEHVRLYKSYGIQYVTADDSFAHPVKGDSAQKTYGFRLANIGAWPASFHPDRTHNNKPWDPSLFQLQQLARFNGQYILSETVAWADYSGNCDGLRTCDIQRIEDYANLCAQVPECGFTFHCEACLNGTVPTYIPEGR